MSFERIDRDPLQYKSYSKDRAADTKSNNVLVDTQQALLSFKCICSIKMHILCNNTLLLLLLYFHSSAENSQMVGRVVFGEARGESTEGQLAVAYTIVNRVSHAGYPNNLYSVVHQTYGSGIYQYNTLSDPRHTTQWEAAKRMNTPEYRNAIKAAEDALCCRVSDPTTCATDYCAHDPCSATSSNRYWQATNKMHIGHHYFVCRVPA